MTKDNLQSIYTLGAKVHKDFLSRASEDELREYLNTFDDGIHSEEMRLFDEECRRRTIKNYESKQSGEWI